MKIAHFFISSKTKTIANCLNNNFLPCRNNQGRDLGRGSEGASPTKHVATILPFPMFPSLLFSPFLLSPNSSFLFSPILLFSFPPFLKRCPKAHQYWKANGAPGNNRCFTYIDEGKLFFRQPVKNKKKENYWSIHFQHTKKNCARFASICQKMTFWRLCSLGRKNKEWNQWLLLWNSRSMSPP